MSNIHERTRGHTLHGFEDKRGYHEYIKSVWLIKDEGYRKKLFVRTSKTGQIFIRCSKDLRRFRLNGVKYWWILKGLGTSYSTSLVNLSIKKKKMFDVVVPP